MILALLLAAAEPMSALDTERAFIADAQKLGQWTAFRKYAADDAVIFVPQQVNAQEFLKGRADPPVAVYWWPGKSFVSCDGSYAVNTGPWVRQYGKAVGYFTTVWQRQPDGSWKWIYDGGDGLDTPRAEGGDIKAEIAACPKVAPPPTGLDEIPSGAKYVRGSSNDESLRWEWEVLPDGSRTFTVSIWNGSRHEVVIEDKVAAP
ncbi:hypothetical protein [Sphingomonas sp.]|uniref:hypothetical protein n=1 Tax=Sphingomonas sp. TaxID=28214 RepID=UPI0025EC405F|nr:hypothetical protein [Sphingomonas sp.]